MNNYLLYDLKWQCVLSCARCSSFETALEVFKSSCDAWIDTYENVEDRERARDESKNYAVIELSFSFTDKGTVTFTGPFDKVVANITKEVMLYESSEESNG